MKYPNNYSNLVKKEGKYLKEIIGLLIELMGSEILLLEVEGTHATVDAAEKHVVAHCNSLLVEVREVKTESLDQLESLRKYKYLLQVVYSNNASSFGSEECLNVA